MKKSKDIVEYRGSTVGHIETRRGLDVFDWAQRPLHFASTEDTTVYGMGVGLCQKLENEGVTYVEIEGELLLVNALTSYKMIWPDNDVFDDTPPEPQRLIEVDA